MCILHILTNFADGAIATVTIMIYMATKKSMQNETSILHTLFLL